MLGKKERKQLIIKLIENRNTKIDNWIAFKIAFICGPIKSILIIFGWTALRSSSNWKQVSRSWKIVKQILQSLFVTLILLLLYGFTHSIWMLCDYSSFLRMNVKMHICVHMSIPRHVYLDTCIRSSRFIFVYNSFNKALLIFKIIWCVC